VGCVVAALVTPGAGNAAVPLVRVGADRDEPAIAIAGNGVVVGTATRSGGALVRLFPAAGGFPRQLLAVPAPRRGWKVEDLQVAASSARVAVALSFREDGDPLEWRVYSGPPTGPLQLMARVSAQPQSETWAPVWVDVDGDRLLVTEVHAGGSGLRATVHAPGVPPEQAPAQATSAIPVALAGDFIAYFDKSGSRITRVLVADRRSGAIRIDLPIARDDEVEDGSYDLGPGGRLAVTVAGRLLTAAPGGALVRPAAAARHRLLFLRFSDERIVAFASTRFGARRPVVLDPAAGPLRRIGPPSTAMDALVANERSVVWTANGCVIAGGLFDPPLTAVPKGPCPRAEAVLDGDDEVLRGRVLRVRLTCVTAPRSGCRGTVRLRRGRALARARFRIAAGRRRSVRVRFPASTARRLRMLLRRRGRLVLSMDAHLADGRTSRSGGTTAAFIERASPK
jgi:hypothetical protein